VDVPGPPPVPPPATVPAAAAEAKAFKIVGHPGMAAKARAMDLDDTEDKKDYFRAIKTVMPKDEAFGLEPPRLMAFINAVRQRGRVYGWDGEDDEILQIPVDPADPNTHRDNLLDSYGLISVGRVRIAETAYIHTESRAMQNTTMLYHCLMASLTEDAKNAIELWRDDYMVGGAESGVLLLRIIIRESHLDSNAATSVIRTQLSRLYEYMPTVSSDINKFNKYVQGCVRALGARGASSDDLVVHLFAGYKVASDKIFRTYVNRIESEHFDGRDLKPNQLMELMSTKYKQLVLQGTWDAPSADDVKLMAMQAKIDSLSRGRKGGGEAITKDEGGKNSGKPPPIPDPGWLANDTAPDPIDKVMSHKGKKWHYCCEENGGKCGGKWRVHKPSECKGTADPNRKRGSQKQGGRGGPSNGAGDPNDVKRLKIMEVLTAAMEGVVFDE
jgi:hypothetical protein